MTHANFISTPTAVLDAMHDDLQLVGPTRSDARALVAGVLRRLCGLMCPCPPRSILAAAKRALEPLGTATDVLVAELDATLESLLVVGDVIEVSRVGGILNDENRDWLFCGPPSFLELDERCYVFGIAPDDAPVLAGTLREKVRHDGVMRYLDDPEGQLGEALSALGMRRYTAAKWLARTHHEPPERFVAHVLNRLVKEGLHGDMPSAEWLAPATAAYVPYQKRWTPAPAMSGLAIGRAHPEFGPPLWFVATLAAGRIERVLSLPLANMPDRACDQAWRIQLALDAQRGAPGRYRAQPEADGVRVSVSFPLPLSARRRLVLLGGLRNEHPGGGAIWIPRVAWSEAERYLQTELGLRDDQDSSEERSP